jgi:hypothetical protein
MVGSKFESTTVGSAIASYSVAQKILEVGEAHGHDDTASVPFFIK